jgi:hypothetical protein
MLIAFFEQSMELHIWNTESPAQLEEIPEGIQHDLTQEPSDS